MKHILLFVPFLVVLVQGGPQGLAPNVLAKIDAMPFFLKDSINRFNQKMFKSVSSTEDGNIFYSPFSLHMILSQVYSGALNGSTTSEELAKLLDFKSENNEAYLHNYLKVLDTLTQLSKGTIVQIANKLFPAQDLTIKPNFKKAMETFYKSDIQNLDFENAKEFVDIINNFVSNKTNGLIKELFSEDDIDESTRLVMVNAIYFKGNWKYQFQEENTQTQAFHVDQNRQVNFSAMHLTEKLALAQINEIGANVLELPYEDKQFSMLIILPNEATKIQQVQSNLEQFDFTKINERLLKASRPDVDLVLPKFETKFKWENLEETLKSLGVKAMFGKANFENISDEAFSVSKVVHEAIIKVNEEGSEAAAASGVVFLESASLFENAKFIVDKPFIFSIYDGENNLPIFIGRIVDPNGKLKLQ